MAGSSSAPPRRRVTSPTARGQPGALGSPHSERPTVAANYALDVPRTAPPRGPLSAFPPLTRIPPEARQMSIRRGDRQQPGRSSRPDLCLDRGNPLGYGRSDAPRRPRRSHRRGSRARDHAPPGRPRACRRPDRGRRRRRPPRRRAHHPGPHRDPSCVGCFSRSTSAGCAADWPSCSSQIGRHGSDPGDEPRRIAGAPHALAGDRHANGRPPDRPQTATSGRLCHSRTTLTAIRRERGAEGFAALRRALLWAAAH